MGIGYNKAILVGRLVRDPEMNYGKNGTAITKITIAIDKDFKRKDQAQAETDFIRVVGFGKTAEFISNYFHKGSLVMVEGRIQVSKYQAQDGSTRYSTDIIAENVRFMETKKSASENQIKRPYDNDEVITNNDMFDAPSEASDDEVPF